METTNLVNFNKSKKFHLPQGYTLPDDTNDVYIVIYEVLEFTEICYFGRSTHTHTHPEKHNKPDGRGAEEMTHGDIV